VWSASMTQWCNSMSWRYLEKEFYDYADNIEGVNIHYVWTPLASAPDWEQQRVTRFMPLVRSALAENHAAAPTPEPARSSRPRLRKKILKLPLCIFDPQSGLFTDRYLLHYYFEVFQDGHRYYSPLYTEEISTGVGTQPNPSGTNNTEELSSCSLPQEEANMKQSKE